ncbi:hypothetical protein ABEB36_014821 [Hypothenemus hampei]|uniref:Uncharacterized protein n=1 Tax=Hypothenemus hampei TaxID=57062 RepID=A0ABD1E3Q5_HYPHA
MQETQNGLNIFQIDADNGIYIDLLARLVVRIQPKITDFFQIPYDWFYASVHNKLANRIFKEYGLYHTSNKTPLQHLKNVYAKGKGKEGVVYLIHRSSSTSRVGMYISG